MLTKRSIKGWFLSFFREVFVYHNSSLEFRAKLLAAMIGANQHMDECELEILEDIAKEIYHDNEARVDVLVRTTKEYVKKIIENNGLELNELIKSIDRQLQEEKRFCDKINIERLSRFLVCSEGDEETQITQTRILEYLQNEVGHTKA
jgi:poly-beta-hydroxyalkanoate depolymerase